MATTRRELVSLIEQGAIPPEQVARAVQVARLYPSGQAWAVFVDRLLLWLGGLALAFAVLFFVAYNWAEMGRWLRFGMVQAAIVLAVGIAVWGKATPSVKRLALTAAALLVGVLLALFGQVYQTGADPWQLFFSWVVLTLPWVWVARFELLWVLWLGLLNLTIGLYFRTWGIAVWHPVKQRCRAMGAVWAKYPGLGNLGVGCPLPRLATAVGGALAGGG